MKNKRGQQKSNETAVNVVIVLLVIVVIGLGLFLLFKPGVLDKFFNLPGYEASQEDKSIELPAGAQQGSIICDGKPGKILPIKLKVAKQTIKAHWWDFANNQFFIFKSKRNTNLYISGGVGANSAGDYKEIKYAVGNDVVVAKISNNLIVSDLNSVSGAVVDDLKFLNGAHFYTTNLLCRQD